MNCDNIDIERLRNDLMNYYLGASFMVNPAAMMDVQRVKNATDEDLIKIAIKEKVNIVNYAIEETEIRCKQF